tara:strand:+ start:419 stop:880 length:462 start_codon:yes stop_codon:yes gene_type:complete
MRIIKIGFIIGLLVLATYVAISEMTNTKTDDEIINSIYSKTEIFSKAPYSGNTDEKAQHVIMIGKDSWKPGCEENDLCFLPYEKIIKIGETVLFVNEDEFEHNVRLRGDPNYLHFPTDVIKQNEYFVYKFEENGKYQYYCTLHPWMEGIINVK